MRAHREYWTPRVETGVVVAMGPVADPAGGYGVAIIEAASEAALEAMQRGRSGHRRWTRICLREPSYAGDRRSPEPAARAHYLRHLPKNREGRLPARLRWRLKSGFRRWAS